MPFTSALVTAIALQTGAPSETVEYLATFSGAEVGRVTFTKSDDRFSGITKIKIGPQDIQQSIRGTYLPKSRKIKDVELSMPNQKVVIKASREETTVTNNGKTTKVGKLTTDHVFLNFNPAILASIFEELGSGSKSLDVFALEGATNVKINGKFLRKRAATLSNEPTSVDEYQLSISGIDVTYLVRNGHVLAMDVPAQKFRIVQVGAEKAFTDPLAEFPELSQAQYALKEEVIDLSMRDGVKLKATVVRPAADGKFPVILSRTPYGREMESPNGAFYAARGYVYVAQDVRGRGGSQGKWDPMIHESADGFDTLEALTKQSWCNGNIGMIGASYGGYVQWAAATTAHPALKCIVPQVSPPGSAMLNLPYDNGIFMQLPNLWWLRVVDPNGAGMSSVTEGFKNPNGFKTWPLTKLDDVTMGKDMPFFDTWLKREGAKQWPCWNFQSAIANVKIPALHISGWWDGDEIGTQLNWRGREIAGNKAQWLIYGPWSHAFNSSSKYGDVDYGDRAILKLDPLYIRFFDTHLKQSAAKLETEPRVRFFVTGANQWKTATSWPVPASKPVSFFFSGGKDRVSGKLTSSAKTKNFSIEFDPKNLKVPKEFLSKTLDLNGSTTVVKPEASEKSNAFCKTEPFAKAMTFHGTAKMDLFFRCSAKDTDFFALVVDVDPKGVARLVGQPGKLRVSYRKGMDGPIPIRPNQVERVQFETWDFAHEFKKGHRLGVILTSHLWPQYATNPGTGLTYLASKTRIKQISTILTGPKTPSKITLLQLSP